MENNKTNKWVSFTTETGLKGKFKIFGEDTRNDVEIKIVTPMPRRFYYSAVNEAGAYYDEVILPTLTIN